MHFEGIFSLLKHFQLVVEFFFSVFFHVFERFLVEYFCFSQTIEFPLLLVLLNLPSVEDDESMLIFCIKIFQDLKVLLGHLYLIQGFVEHDVNCVILMLLYFSLEGGLGNLFLPLRS